MIDLSEFTLESFAYVKPWQFPYIREHRNTFMLDSGAFTFRDNEKSHPDWDSYVDRLCDFIKAHGIKLWFEIDMDLDWSYRRVREVRRYMENKIGWQTLPAWHPSRGFDDYVAHCRDYEYISIGGCWKPNGEWKDLSIDQHRKLVDVAHENGCKVHELGRTGMKFLKEVRPDSADSSTWVANSRFSSVATFRHGKITSTRLKNRRIIPRQAFARSFTEWVKFQQYAKKFL